MQDVFSPFSKIPFNLRLQPFSLITYGLVGLPSRLRRKPYDVLQIPLPRERGGGTIRCIAFSPSDQKPFPTLRLLHISMHGGVFICRLAENTASFCEALCHRTGCVGVRISDRVAPRHVFPTAHDNRRDVACWLCADFKRLWSADGKNVTVGGFSA